MTPESVYTNIVIKNTVLADILNQYIDSFEEPIAETQEIDGDIIRFYNEYDENCPFTNAPQNLSVVTVELFNGFLEAGCNEDAAFELEEAFDAQNKEILKAYESVEWRSVHEYDLSEPLEDHLTSRELEDIKAEYAESRELSVSEVTEQEFKAYIDKVSRICSEETFSYRKAGEIKKISDAEELGIYECHYSVVE